MSLELLLIQEECAIQCSGSSVYMSGYLLIVLLLEMRRTNSLFSHETFLLRTYSNEFISASSVFSMNSAFLYRKDLIRSILLDMGCRPRNEMAQARKAPIREFLCLRRQRL